MDNIDLIMRFVIVSLNLYTIKITSLKIILDADITLNQH